MAGHMSAVLVIQWHNCAAVCVQVRVFVGCDGSGMWVGWVGLGWGSSPPQHYSTSFSVWFLCNQSKGMVIECGLTGLHVQHSQR